MSEAAKERLFVGIDLPETARRTAAGVIASLEGSVPGARWVPIENLHITIAFLGQTSLGEQVREAVASVASQMPPVQLHLEELGAFPSERRARVLWIGLGGDRGGLTSLARAVWEPLRLLGFQPEDRPFAAHVTLARLRDPAQVYLPDIGRPDARPVAVPVKALTLFSSQRGRGAPVYERVLTAPLLG